MYACVYACVYVLCVCMYVCMHVCIRMYIYVYLYISGPRTHNSADNTLCPASKHTTRIFAAASSALQARTHIHNNTHTHMHTSADNTLCLASKHTTRIFAAASSALWARTHILSLPARARCNVCAYCDAPSSLDEFSTCRCCMAVLSDTLSLLA
jgi:hypothetical protein